jgi:hypothetical protein
MAAPQASWEGAAVCQAYLGLHLSDGASMCGWLRAPAPSNVWFTDPPSAQRLMTQREAGVVVGR